LSALDTMECDIGNKIVT